MNGDYIGTVIDSPYQLYIPAEKFKGQDELVVRVANSMANRIAYMDKKGVDWKIFYNVNMSARKKENVKMVSLMLLIGNQNLQGYWDL